MPQPWFDPSTYSWIPGTVFGTSLGVLGGLAGTLASLGRGRKFILTMWGIFTVIAVALLVTSIIAWSVGQPYGVWYGLGLPGLLGVILLPSLYPTITTRYREAEERRIQAADFPNGR